MTTATIGTRLSPVEIIFDIQSVCEGGANKTSVMYRSNLSHDQLVKYLGYLTDQDLLILDARRYRVTEKGTAMLDEVSQVIDLLRGLRGDEA